MRELEELIKSKDGARKWRKHQAKLKADEAYRIADNCYDDVKMDASVEKRAPVLVGSSRDLCITKQFPDPDLTKLPKHLQFAYALKRDEITREDSVLAPDVRAEYNKLKELLHLFSRPETTMADRIDFQEKFIKPILDKFKKEDRESQKPGESFEGEYQKFWDNNPQPIDLSPEELEKLVEQMVKTEKEKSKSPEQKALEAYAAKEGVDLHDLENYRSWKKREVDSIVDSETNEKAIDELRKQFERIVKERKRDMQVPVFPQEEGDVLVLPAEAYVESRAGVPKPKVWEEIDTRPKLEKIISNFDLHIVCDTSGSMQGEKLIEQRKAAMLLLEAMQEFYKTLALDAPDIEYPLSIRTECLTFGSDVESLKNLAPNLTEKERVGMYKALSSAPGSTADYKAVKAIADAIDPKTKLEIMNGERLKLVIVMTDGGSDDTEKLKKELQKLRDSGAVVVGVAITDSAKSAIEIYTPDKEMAEEASDLPQVFKRILDRCLSRL